MNEIRQKINELIEQKNKIEEDIYYLEQNAQVQNIELIEKNQLLSGDWFFDLFHYETKHEFALEIYSRELPEELFKLFDYKEYFAIKLEKDLFLSYDNAKCYLRLRNFDLLAFAMKKYGIKINSERFLKIKEKHLKEIKIIDEIVDKYCNDK